MYLIPVLLAVDAPDAISAQALAEHDLRDRAIFIGGARRLSAIAASTAEFELRVYANNIELPPAASAA